jgi:hypothetical protein
MAGTLQKRHIARKVRIVDFLSARYVKQEGLNPNYIALGREEVSRINVIGVVIQAAEQENGASVAIDDGTGSVAVRSFEPLPGLKDVNLGDVVLLIGRPREFNGERYVLIESLKKVAPGWAQVRGRELSSAMSSPVVEKTEEVVLGDVGTRSTILNLIRDLDEGNGVAVEDLATARIKDAGDVDAVVEMLLKEGDVFEVGAGRLKVLE